MEQFLTSLIITLLVRCSSSANTRYVYDSSLDNMKCVGDEIEFEKDTGVESILQCTALCGQTPGCKGVFHKRSDAAKCHGCKKKYTTPAGLSSEPGTKYYGPYDRCASTPCLNGGTCADSVATYACTCAIGYEDVNCQSNTNDCATNPCLNGAVCNDGVNAYTCTFDFEFGGENYETNCTYAIGDQVLMCTNPKILTLRIYKNATSGTNAAAACGSIGWKLVKIDTLRKQEFIRNLLKAIQEFLDEDYWIDGSNDYGNVSPNGYVGVAWRFADDTNVPMTQGDFWEYGTPNSPNIEHCVRMRKDSDHLWNDKPCIGTNGYICEIP